MFDTLLEILKKQRMAWSWAVIIGLFLIVAGHAPLLPVIAGCLLALAPIADLAELEFRRATRLP